MNSNHKKLLGLHIPLIKNYSYSAMIAKYAGCNIVQLFPIRNKENKHLPVLDEDLTKFKTFNFETIYLHSSFKINLASSNKNQAKLSQYLFNKELKIAKELNANYIVIHLGSAQSSSKKSAIERITNFLNKVIEKENKIKILLENSAHNGKVIGGDLNDFIIIRQQIAFPDKIKFCIDFAHAFVYGYDLSKTELFISLLDKTVDIKNIKLIHLNDSSEKFGNKKDIHAPPGYGNIGKEVLQKLIEHPMLKNIPMIVELPFNKLNKSKEILQEIKNW